MFVLVLIQKGVWVGATKRKKNVDILAPAMVLEYNPSMSTTDITDHVFSCNCPGIRSKKWWFPLLTFCLQSSLWNSCLICQETLGAGTAYLDFLHHVVQTYFVSYRKSAKIPREQMFYGNKRVEKKDTWDNQNDQTSQFSKNTEKCEDVLFAIDQVGFLNVMFMFKCNASLLFTRVNDVKLALLIVFLKTLTHASF